MSDSTRIQAYLEAHERIIVEREDARRNLSDDNHEFKRGHINGLNEARNEIESLLTEALANDQELEVNVELDERWLSRPDAADGGE